MFGAVDFTTIDVWAKGGLVTFYLLFVMEVATQLVLLQDQSVDFSATFSTLRSTWRKPR